VRAALGDASGAESDAKISVDLSNTTTINKKSN
jgi:hypothetical protein